MMPMTFFSLYNLLQNIQHKFQIVPPTFSKLIKASKLIKFSLISSIILKILLSTPKTLLFFSLCIINSKISSVSFKI